MDTALGESVVTRRTVHIEDTLAERRYDSGTEAIRVARGALGYRMASGPNCCSGAWLEGDFD